MAPKTAAAASGTKKSSSGPSHPPYKDMIKNAIIQLKQRNGSSRQALKKYILANNKSITATPAAFDQQFNKALRTGVEKGDFNQPKGASGPVKLAKKDTTKKAPAKKTAAAKVKTATAKKASTAAKPKVAVKKTTTAKKPAAKKATTKANTSTKRKTKATPAAPAVVDAPKVTTKTKSGRVTKTTAKPAAAKKAAPKKAAAKKA